MGMLLSVSLIMIGTLAISLGVHYYHSEKNIRIDMLAMGIAAGIWGIGYGVLGLCDNFAMASVFRRIGLAGVDLFMVAETLLYFARLDIPKKVHGLIHLIYTGLMLLDWFWFGADGVDLFIRKKNWTTWQGVQCPARIYHNIFIAFITVSMFCFATVWYRKMTLRRDRAFLRRLYIANFAFLLSIVPDTVIVLRGADAIPTSALGAIFTFLLIYEAARKYNGFSVSQKNMMDYIENTIHAGIIVLDSDFNTVHMNGYAQEYLECEQDARWDTLFEIENPQELLNKALQEGFCETKCKTKTGQRFLLNISVAWDNYHAPFGYVGVIYDISREEELLHLAEAANRAKSEFLASMSHEIRTPINVVLGMNEMIERDSTDPAILEYSGNIRTAGKMLLTQMNDILDLVTLDSDEIHIVERKYSTTAMIEEYSNMCTMEAESRNLKFHLQVDEQMPVELIGDEVHVRQIILNLITNAMKYTHSGSVSLFFGGAYLDGGYHLQVMVQDTGIGIRKEDIKMIFDPFGRVEQVKNSSIQGTGVGLSIVQKLIQLMDGQIEVESTPGQGSTFTVTIPQLIGEEKTIAQQKDEDAMEALVPAQEKRAMLRTLTGRILVVDDMAMNIKLVRTYLKDCKLKVDSAENGQDALEKAYVTEYDLILMDHMMPVLDGIEALHRIREDASNPNHTTPIVVLTANVSNGIEEKYYREGFDAYLSKPLAAAKLTDIILQYVKGDIIGENPEEPSAAQPELPKTEDTLLARLDFLNLTNAMQYCANQVSFLHEILIEYVNSNKVGEIEDAYREERWADYERLVHGVKSMSYTIGADDVAELAYALELAQKRDDIPYILEHHEAFLRDYKIRIEHIRKEV